MLSKKHVYWTSRQNEHVGSRLLQASFAFKGKCESAPQPISDRKLTAEQSKYARTSQNSLPENLASDSEAPAPERGSEVLSGEGTA